MAGLQGLRKHGLLLAAHLLPVLWCALGALPPGWLQQAAGHVQGGGVGWLKAGVEHSGRAPQALLSGLQGLPHCLGHVQVGLAGEQLAQAYGAGGAGAGASCSVLLGAGAQLEEHKEVVLLVQRSQLLVAQAAHQAGHAMLRGLLWQLHPAPVGLCAGALCHCGLDAGLLVGLPPQQRSSGWLLRSIHHPGVRQANAGIVKKVPRSVLPEGEGVCVDGVHAQPQRQLRQKVQGQLHKELRVLPWGAHWVSANVLPQLIHQLRVGQVGERGRQLHAAQQQVDVGHREEWTGAISGLAQNGAAKAQKVNPLDTIAVWRASWVSRHWANQWATATVSAMRLHKNVKKILCVLTTIGSRPPASGRWLQHC